MTWDLKSAGINPTAAKLYESPYAPHTSKSAQGSSRLNHSVAQYSYSADSFLKSMNTQSSPMPAKKHMMRYQLDSRDVTTFIPGAVLTTRDAYANAVKRAETYVCSTEINSSQDFRMAYEKKQALAAKVKRQMIGQSSSIVTHKVYGTTLPSWYITKMIFLILLEQECAIEHGETDKTITPSAACDIIYDSYMTIKPEIKEGMTVQDILDGNTPKTPADINNINNNDTPKTPAEVSTISTSTLSPEVTEAAEAVASILPVSTPYVDISSNYTFNRMGTAYVKTAEYAISSDLLSAPIPLQQLSDKDLAEVAKLREALLVNLSTIAASHAGQGSAIAGEAILQLQDAKFESTADIASFLQTLNMLGYDTMMNKTANNFFAVLYERKATRAKKEIASIVRSLFAIIEAPRSEEVVEVRDEVVEIVPDSAPAEAVEVLKQMKASEDVGQTEGDLASSVATAINNAETVQDLDKVPTTEEAVIEVAGAEEIANTPVVPKSTMEMVALVDYQIMRRMNDIYKSKGAKEGYSGFMKPINKNMNKNINMKTNINRNINRNIINGTAIRPSPVISRARMTKHSIGIPNNSINGEQFRKPMWYNKHERFSKGGVVGIVIMIIVILVVAAVFVYVFVIRKRRMNININNSGNNGNNEMK